MEDPPYLNTGDDPNRREERLATIIPDDQNKAYDMKELIGMETSLGLSLRLLDEGVLTIGQLIMKMSTGPASVLKVPGGTLAPGSPADVTVIDLKRSWTVDKEQFRSKSRNTPFHGWTLKGKAVLTIKGGEVTYSDL
jgi:dihydroorotase